MTLRPHRQQSCLLRTLAILLAAAFIASAVLAVLFFNVETVLLNGKTYKDTLANQDVYSRVPALAAEQIKLSMDTRLCPGGSCADPQQGGSARLLGVPTALLAGLDRADWEFVLSILLAPDWVQAQSESVIDQVIIGLKNSAGPVNPSISLSGMRDNLTDEEIQQITQTLLASAAICTPDQLMTVAAIFLGISSEELPFCVPTEEFRPLLEDQLELTVRERVGALPNDMTIGTGRPEESAAGVEESPGISFQDMRRMFLFGPLIALALLGLIALVAVRSWAEAGRWLGLPVLVSGLIVMAIAALVLLAYPWVVSNWVLPNLPDLISPGIVQAVQDISQAVALRYAFWVGLTAGVLFVSGAVLLILSLFIRPRRGRV